MRKMKSNRELVGMPTNQHALFFEYLKISPSYYLAHQFRNGEITFKYKKDQPNGFDKVLSLYDKAGDVYAISFDDWWDKFGIDVLAPDRKKAKLLFTVDLTKPKEVLLEEYKSFLDGINFKPFSPLVYKISFLANRIRMATLDDRLKLVLHRSSFGANKAEDGGKIPYWAMSIDPFIGAANIKKSKAIPKIVIDNNRKKSNKVKKSYITMLISKNLKEALYFAENAARGIFPSKQPIKNCLAFNYLVINEQKEKGLEGPWFDNWLKKFEQGLSTYPRGVSKESKLTRLQERNKWNKFMRKHKKQFEEKGYAEFKERVPGTNTFNTVKYYK
jgi:hypothetical protein